MEKSEKAYHYGHAGGEVGGQNTKTQRNYTEILLVILALIKIQCKTNMYVSPEVEFHIVYNTQDNTWVDLVPILNLLKKYVQICRKKQSNYK